MSKHWDPHRDRSPQATGWAFRWNRPQQRGRAARRGKSGHWRFSAGEVRLTLLGGFFAGLVVAFAPSLWPSAAPETGGGAARIAPPGDPYAEARRSRAILEAQESRAAPVALAGRGGGRAVSPAAVRVIDGDTFDLGGMRVRIADIDTPETDGRCAYESQLAARATRRMRALLSQGPFELHRIPDGRDTDRYGRKLRIVTRDGRSLGDQLVSEGLARTWTGRREPWC